MKQYFRKFQTVCSPDPIVAKELNLIHDADMCGPIRANFPSTALPLHSAWLGGFRDLKLENREEPANGTALGGYISTCHISGDRRERSHAGNAYYEPISGRTNLSLTDGAVVQKILFNQGAGGRAVATSVSYVKNGKQRSIGVRGEVILAAGAFASPQLLELSGIGNSELLQRHGLETIYHNPNVGENLQDHIRSGISFERDETDEDGESLSTAEARRLYEESRSGPWADKACYTFAHIPLAPFLSTEEQHELSQLLNHHLKSPTTRSYQQKFNDFMGSILLSPAEATATAFCSRKAAVPGTRCWNTLFAMLSYPFSRGSAHIQSRDVTVKPKLEFNYYSHPLDLEIHARHLLAMERVASTPSMSDYITSNKARLTPEFENLSLDKAKELLRSQVLTNYHPCGSCSMMPENSGGVVDSTLKVYGTQNVRVVDASVLPVIPRGNIITTVYAVAEKAADLISTHLGTRRTT